MTEEQEQLLMKDLCGRLPYGVKGNYLNEDGSPSNDELLRNITICPLYITKPNGMVLTGEVKPYLFPLSSMTDEQRNLLEEWDLNEPMLDLSGKRQVYVNLNLRIIDWLNAHHFDYRGLIEQGLAIDATDLNIYK